MKSAIIHRPSRWTTHGSTILNHQICVKNLSCEDIIETVTYLTPPLFDSFMSLFFLHLISFFSSSTHTCTISPISLRFDSFLSFSFISFIINLFPVLFYFYPPFLSASASPNHVHESRPHPREQSAFVLNIPLSFSTFLYIFQPSHDNNTSWTRTTGRKFGVPCQTTN